MPWLLCSVLDRGRKLLFSVSSSAICTEDDEEEAGDAGLQGPRPDRPVHVPPGRMKSCWWQSEDSRFLLDASDLELPVVAGWWVPLRRGFFLEAAGGSWLVSFDGEVCKKLLPGSSRKKEERTL